MSIGV